MISTNEYHHFISAIVIKFAIFAFIFVVGIVYFNTLAHTTETVLLSILIAVILFSMMFVMFRRDFLRYDAELNEELYANSFYKTAIANSPVALIVLEGNKIVYHNGAARKLFNRNRRFFETSEIYDLIYPEDRYELQEIILSASGREDFVLRINKDFSQRDGTIDEHNYVNFSVQKQLFSDKVRFIIFAYDITKLHTKYDTMVEHISILEALINGSPRAISIFDAEGRLYFQTQQAKLQQIPGTDGNFASVIEYNINRNLLNTGFQMALLGHSYIDEKIIEKKSDYNKWAKITFTPIVSSKGNKFVRYAIDDVTDYKRKITDHEKQIHLNLMMFEESKLATVLWDAEGNFKRANKAFYDLFQLNPGILGGKMNLFKNDTFLMQTINEIIFNINDPTKKVAYTNKNVRYGFKKYLECIQKCEPFEIVFNVDVSKFIRTNMDETEKLFDDSEVNLSKIVSDGSSIWMRNFSYPVYDEAGCLIYYASEFFDATDYFALMSKYNTSKSYLEAIANNFSTGVILIVDNDSNVVFLGGETNLIKRMHAMGYNPVRQVFNFTNVPEFNIFRDNVLDALKNKTSKISSCKMFGNSYDIQFLPIHNTYNKVEYCIAIGFDIADRENYEKQLIAQKNLHEKTFSESTIPTIIVDVTGKYINANTKYLSFMGFDEEQVSNTDIYDKKCWLNKSIIVENFEKILKGAEATQFEFSEETTFSLFDEDDDMASETFKFTLIGKCYPILDSDNAITSVVFNFIDISDSKQLINALESINAINDIITKNFPNGILIVLDDTHKIILCEGAHEMKNLKMEKIKIYDKNINDIDAPIFNSIKPHLEYVINMKQKTNFDFDVNIMDEDGDTADFHYETFIIPILSSSSNSNYDIEHIFIYFNNITVRKQLEKAILDFNINLEKEVVLRTAQLQETTNDLEVYINELQEIQKELEVAKIELAANLNKELEINQLKSQFINLMSHEFRTPLTIIQTCTYLMETYYDMQMKDMFDRSMLKIITAIDMMTKLLDNILFLDDIKDKEAYFATDEVILFIKTVINETVESFGAEQNVIISSNVDELIMLTDERLLKEIVTNLLANAIKYSPKDSDILVGIEDKETVLVITIKDFGPGIADDIIDKIFETFTRSTNVTSISGSGLGLSIVKNCVNLLNGEVTFETGKNKGTKFTVTLPK